MWMNSGKNQNGDANELYNMPICSTLNTCVSNVISFDVLASVSNAKIPFGRYLCRKGNRWRKMQMVLNEFQWQFNKRELFNIVFKNSGIQRIIIYYIIMSSPMRCNVIAFLRNITTKMSGQLKKQKVWRNKKKYKLVYWFVHCNGLHDNNMWNILGIKSYQHLNKAQACFHYTLQ